MCLCVTIHAYADGTDTGHAGRLMVGSGMWGDDSTVWGGHWGGGGGGGGITEQVPPSVQSDSGGHLVNASPCLRAALAASAQSSQP